MRKNFLILMLLSLLPMAGWAADLEGQTFTKEDFKYTILTSNAETKTGTVKVEKSAAASGQTTLTIPESVTATVEGDDNFDVSYSGSMTFTVTKIADEGFKGLTSLKTIVIPASIREIGQSAFASDYSLTTLQFAPGSNLETIGEYAFSSWIAGTFDLSGADGLTTLPAKLLLSATANRNQYVQKVILPSSITDINTALANLTILDDVNISSTNLASLEDGALEKTALTSLKLPATCLSVEDGALKGTKIATLTINSNATAGAQTIGGGTKNLYGDDADDLDVLTSVTFVGEFKGTVKANAFKGNTSLATITFDAISGTVEAAAFTDNAALATITTGAITGTINASFESELTDGADVPTFVGADLTIASIGAAAQIKDDAFTGLKTVTITNGIAATTATGTSAFAGENLSTINIGAVTGKIGASFDSEYAEGATLTIASLGNGAVINGGAFDNLKSVVFTGGITGAATIKDDAFAGDNLETITVNNIANGAVIGEGTNAAFASDLAEGAVLTIGNIGNATIADNAFTGLKSVEIGNIATTSTAIGAGAFAGDALESINVGDITGKIGASFDSEYAEGATLTIASLGNGAVINGGAFDNLKSVVFTGGITGAATIKDDAFAGDNLETITVNNIASNAVIGDGTNSAFASGLAEGAVLTIGNIGNATIADNAFTGLKSVEIGNIATTSTAIGAGAFAGDALESINVGDITGKIGASFVSTLAAGAELTIKGITANTAQIAGGAFSGINDLTITNGISANAAINTGAFVFIDAAELKANLGNISNGTLQANIITGPTTDANQDLAITVGNVSVALSNALATNISKGKITMGNISKAVKVEVFGGAPEVVVGDINTGGSITGTPTDNATLTKVTFGAVNVENGITGTSFTNCTKLAEVNFNGTLVANAVAADAFKTAGSAADAVDGIKMVVTYLPASNAITKPFKQATFGANGDDAVVKLVTTEAFYVNYDETNAGDYFYRVTASYTKAPETGTITFGGQAVSGYYYARLFVAKDETAEITKVNGLTVYSAYTDGEDIYMNPLRVYNGKYQINGEDGKELRAALIVKSNSNTDITYNKNVETTTKQSVQNYDDKYGILYNDNAEALPGAQITMEDGNVFKLTDATTTNWSTVAAAADHNSIMLVSNPAKSNSISFADFDPETQPLVSIAAGGYYLLVKKAAATTRSVVWLDEDGNTTAIETIESTPAQEMNANNAIYNLQGVRVNKTSQKGIYIHNGKKFVVK